MTKAFVPRATNGQIFPWNNIRLPPFIKPTRYNITIHPNLTTLEVKGIDSVSFYQIITLLYKYIDFSGQVSIEFVVEKDTNFIVLHSKNLTITDKVRLVIFFQHDALLFCFYYSSCPCFNQTGNKCIEITSVLINVNTYRSFSFSFY